MATDFEAEGLLDGVWETSMRAGPGSSPCGTLEQEGFSPEELRRATVEDRLALLPLERAALELVEGSAADADGELLRAGLAAGEALPRAGDWYGRPVNLASRLTAFARRGSVVAASEVREAARDGFAWSFVGRRRFKGVSGQADVFRVRSGAARRPLERYRARRDRPRRAACPPCRSSPT